MRKVDWSGIPFYVVGVATGNVLRNMPRSPFTPSSQNIIGEGSGTGEALAKVLIDDQLGRGSQLPLLYLTGDKNRDTLPSLVQAAGLDLEPLQVYATRGSPSFSTDVRKLFQRSNPFGEWGFQLLLEGDRRLTTVSSCRSYAMVCCVLCALICRIRTADPTGTHDLLSNGRGSLSRRSVLQGRGYRSHNCDTR